MASQTDLLVIGSGAAGAMAFARAKQLSKNALLVSKSCGATGYSFGSINGLEEGPELRLFQEICAPIRLKSKCLAANEFGEVKSCDWVQKSQAYDLSQHPKGKKLYVVGFKGLPSFCAQSVSKMLRYHGYDAQPCHPELDPGSSLWPDQLAFAKDFDRLELGRKIIRSLEKLSDSSSRGTEGDVAIQDSNQGSLEQAHLFFPPCLGLNPPDDFLEKLSEQLGVTATELLAGSHSIPGLRLGNILSKPAIRAQVVEAQYQDGRVVSVRLNSGEEIRTKNIILATGRFLGGGLKAQPDPQESLFGLPLRIQVDERQRPLNRFGQVFAKNLFAAGSIIENQSLNRLLEKPPNSSSRGAEGDVAIQDSMDCFSAKALRNDDNPGLCKNSNIGQAILSGYRVLDYVD